tara:strand:- start:119 stop:721 length:603 start_codon:yes stop_codon:yes gene_type:complete
MTAKIKLNAASGGGSFSLQAPSSSANNRVFTLPDSADATLLTSTTATGKILQVVSATKTDTLTTTSQPYVDITGLSVSITPSSSSNKVLVSYTLSMAATGFPMFKVLRDSTDVFVGDAASNRVRCFFGGYTGGLHTSMVLPVSGNFLDSPSTTSSTTYKVQTGTIYSTGYAIYINRSQVDNDVNYFPRTASSITVMEVAA